MGALCVALVGLTQLVATAVAAQTPDAADPTLEGGALGAGDPAAVVPIIALVRSRGDQVIALRLAAELDALGYLVVEITGPAATRALVDLARIHDVDAFLRPTPSRTGIELLVLMPPGPDAQRPEAGMLEDVVSVGRRRHDDLLALRAVETLRARLLEVGLIAPPEVFEASEVAELEPEPGPLEPTKSESVDPWMWIELAPSYGGNTEMGFGPRMQVALRAEPTSVWSVSVLGNFALTSREVRRSVGEAEVTAHWLALATDVRLVQSAWAWDVGAGVGAVRLFVDGSAETPFEGRSTAVTTSLPFVRTAVHPELSPLLRLRLEVLAGWAMPRTVVGFLDQDAPWGRPELQASLVVSTAVPGLQR